MLGTGVWNSRTAAMAFGERYADTVSDVAFSADGSLCAGAHRFGGAIRIRETRSGRVLREISLPHGAMPASDSIAVSADARFVAAAYGGRRVGVWRVDSGAAVLDETFRYQTTAPLTLAPDGATLAGVGSRSGSTRVHVWDVETSTDVAANLFLEGAVSGVQFGPRGESLLVQLGDRVGSWMIAPRQPAAAIVASARRTNLRVCRRTMRVVSVDDDAGTSDPVFARDADCM